MTMRPSVFLLLAAAVLAAPYAQAQENPDSVKHRNECRLAAQIMRTGNPAPHAEWAANYVPFCDPALHAEALSHALLRLRSSTDDSALLLHWGGAGFVQDPSVFDAVIAVARDGAASLSSRLWALRTLAKYLDPEGQYTIQSMSGADCITGRALPGHSGLRVINPLHPDWRERARDAGEQVAQTENNQSLRSAARCVRSAPVAWDGPVVEDQP